VAEAVILTCDVCGKVAEESVTFTVRGWNAVKDLCGTHIAELVRGSRAPRRGRKRATVTSVAPTPAKRRGRPKGSKNKTTAKRTRRKSANGRRKATNGRRRRTTKTTAASA
jgi:hypothetical protein